MPEPVKFGLYLAVLPSYRNACIEYLRLVLREDVKIWVSEAHLDSTVRTGIPAAWFSETRMLRWRGRVFLQTDHLLAAARAASLIVDLNPRSLTAWLLLVVRRLLRRPTAVWGHLHGQNGPTSKTAHLRLLMRRLATGTIVYTYSSKELAKLELPKQPVFVASNALYFKRDIFVEDAPQRNSVLYVGRFVQSKKVDLLIRGFAVLAQEDNEVQLELVGGGGEEAHLRSLADALGISSRVIFHGWKNSPNDLREIYSRAFTSVSPGFVGLQITQTIGFGVPICIARREPHSPEVELATEMNAEWFDSDDPSSLAGALRRVRSAETTVLRDELSQTVRDNYSAERMAEGLIQALEGNHP
ncbi:glycosyltransferase family 4 protein [Curtobacterium sp. 20TX0008]|uniref:glycosyltransferase family 4 protein n=1 Tax=Curtobacterium sp. 20TX0008 TaxID=3022018 RepID=UPI00232C2B7D|nr:glycosyltransferase [Curtobacterium sp. 20TX0008]MDB6427908.1 glycosyltransferase [Curtobacterium sp. 20TX0008]